jgi:hypothetical protein
MAEANGNAKGNPKANAKGVTRQGGKGNGKKVPKGAVVLRPAEAGLRPAGAGLRDPAFAVRMLEQAIEETYRRMRKADDQDAFVKLANSLAMATTRLVNAHRILALLASGHTSVEEALKELQRIGFEED